MTVVERRSLRADSVAQPVFALINVDELVRSSQHRHRGEPDDAVDADRRRRRPRSGRGSRWRRSITRGSASTSARCPTPTLESPILQVGTTAPFVIAFDHRFGFEDNGGAAPFFDGGVIEISRNGGPWEDISTFVEPGYGGTLFDGSGNPLAGRQAFVGRNAAFPARRAR